jgi:hypothetical protein
LESSQVYKIGYFEKISSNLSLGTEYKHTINESKDDMSETSLVLSNEFIGGKVNASINNYLNLRIYTNIQLLSSIIIEASLDTNLLTDDRVYSLNFQFQ